MTVYVDDSRIPAKVGRLNAKWCHLTADTKEELHAFAQTIGLRRQWFQDKPRGLWHYDVTESKRQQAVALGAVEINSRDLTPYRKPGREGREPMVEADSEARIDAIVARYKSKHS